MKEIMQDFKQLASALKSGDLSGAQKAYSALQQLLPDQSQGGNPVSTDFAALGKALQSGDLSTAQSAFSQLQNDLQSASQSGGANSLTQAMKGHHHHHHASSSQSSTASSTDHRLHPGLPARSSMFSREKATARARHTATSARR